MNPTSMLARTKLMILLLMIAGCRDRSVEIAREAADRQAAQNEAMIGLQREVAHGAERLVTADAQSRHELLAAHRRLQVDYAQLSAHYLELESERRRVDAERRATTTLAAALRGGGLFVVALATLAVVHRLLGAAQTDAACAELATELLESDLLDASRLHEQVPRLDTPPALPRLPEN